ncbi:MBL fold metallo-hydrolase [Burkholderia glumae]|uniref:MBL fold metallo-hydrolase n=1 Tax=Burkholderia glumae TaxID=337 RepID=UPI0002DCA4E7|nr:MBL fold metallo-hydrolase [Burkholderia glumae]PJO24954.1 MBL fold metallo-hydrolase [Burkholderia glumae AU6208]QHE09007.1 MBL fold metallo-hydrolase [Burkholderia glumae AU6208]
MTSQPAFTVDSFFDPATNTATHVVVDTATRECAIVDPVLDFDPKSGRTHHRSAERVAAQVEALGARVRWLLETHVHADHLSAAPLLQARLGGEIAIGREVTQVQKVFGTLFDAGPDFVPDGRPFDRLVDDGDTLALGRLAIRAMHTPGHTPACMTYLVARADGTSAPAETAAFVGDTLFMPDYGTARCDFPGGDARTLYRSIRKVLSLPPDTPLYLCHDYAPQGRPICLVTTVGAQRRDNIHVHEGIDEDTFVAMRTARDATLEMPVLILPSVQVNMRAGRLPEPAANGVRYLKLPIDAL